MCVRTVLRAGEDVEKPVPSRADGGDVRCYSCSGKRHGIPKRKEKQSSKQATITKARHYYTSQQCNPRDIYPREMKPGHAELTQQVWDVQHLHITKKGLTGLAPEGNLQALGTSYLVGVSG